MVGDTLFGFIFSIELAGGNEVEWIILPAKSIKENFPYNFMVFLKPNNKKIIFLIFDNQKKISNITCLVRWS